MANYQNIIALYDDIDDAEHTVDDLLNSGFQKKNISIIASDPSGDYKRRLSVDDLDNMESRMDRSGDDVHADEGAGFGAVIGTLVGLGAALIPGIGGVVAAGPFAAALFAGIGAATGAATGGIIGGLVDLGVDEEQAGYYAEGVRRGGILVIARVSPDHVDDAMDIMSRHDPVDLNERAKTWRQSGWSGFSENAEPYTSDQVNTERQQYNTTNRRTTDRERITEPVIEEELQVGKRTETTGGVRVSKHVSQHREEEDVDLRREEVHVDRRRVNRPATDADIDEFQEETMEFTEREERPVVSKEARVVEEVVIYKDVDIDHETVGGTVRRTDVDVQRLDADEVGEYSQYEPSFRKHFEQEYRDNDYTYNQYAPAYRYGYSLATVPEYRQSDWNRVEPEARRRWEAQNKGSWDSVRPSVYYAWTTVRP